MLKLLLLHILCTIVLIPTFYINVFATIYIFIEPDQYRCVIRLSKVQRSSPYEYGSQTERAGNRE